MAEITSGLNEYKVIGDESHDESDRSSLRDNEEVLLPTNPTAIAAIKVVEDDDQVKNESDDQADIPISAILESPLPIYMDEDSSRSPMCIITKVENYLQKTRINIRRSCQKWRHLLKRSRLMTFKWVIRNSRLPAIK